VCAANSSHVRTVETKLTFIWRHVGSSPYILLLVVNDVDKEHDYFTMRGGMVDSLIYHSLPAYDEGVYGISADEKGKFTTKQRGTFKFAPSAFADEGGYVTRETELDQEMMLGIVREDAEWLEEGRRLLKRPEESIGEIQVIAEVVNIWLQSFPPDFIYALYIGTSLGSMVLLPGEYIDWPYYDCRERPWYMRAIANPDTMAISTPYQTGGIGGGLVISVR